MKKMLRSTFSSLTALVLLAGLLVISLPAHGQVAGVYSPNSIGSGGLLVVPASSTNTFLTYALTNGVQTGAWTTNNNGVAYNVPSSFATQTNLTVNVSSYDYVGFTWAYQAGSNATVDVYASYDNAVSWGSNKFASYSGQAAPSGQWTTNVLLDCRGITHLGFVQKNAGTMALSNVLLNVNLKSSTIYTLPPGNYGRTPGTPITVPNFP